MKIYLFIFAYDKCSLMMPSFRGLASTSIRSPGAKLLTTWTLNFRAYFCKILLNFFEEIYEKLRTLGLKIGNLMRKIDPKLATPNLIKISTFGKFHKASQTLRKSENFIFQNFRNLKQLFSLGKNGKFFKNLENLFSFRKIGFFFKYSNFNPEKIFHSWKKLTLEYS